MLDADGKPLIASSTVGHCLTGVGAILLGRNTATYRIWDGLARSIIWPAGRKSIPSDRLHGHIRRRHDDQLPDGLDDRIQAAALAAI